MKFFKQVLKTDTEGASLPFDARFAYNLTMDVDYTMAVNPSAFAVPTADINATTNQFTENAHGLLTGSCVRVTSNATLPDPLLTATDYFAIRTAANTFKLATTRANAVLGTSIDLVDVGSGPAAFNVAPGDIDTGTEVITSVGHGLSTGWIVQVSTDGTALPSPLVAATNYFAIKATDDTFKLATSLANATGGTAIDISTVGTPAAFDIAADTDIDVLTNIITEAAHGLSTGWVVQVSTDGLALPDPLLVSTNYYVIKMTDNTFKLAASLVDAQAGTEIDFIDTGSAASTITVTPTLPVMTVTPALPTVTFTPQTSVATSVLEYCSDVEITALSTWKTLSSVDMMTGSNSLTTIVDNTHMFLRTNLNITKGALSSYKAVCFGKSV